MKIPRIYGLVRQAMLPLAIVVIFLCACNKKDDTKADIDYVVAQSVAVTNFTLQPNARVMTNLDSVYFSIDLEHRVIYNADSLPVGTKIDKLVPLISYPSTVGSAEITMTGGQTRTGTVNYINNPSDSIDFTGKVSLRLTSLDGTLSSTYQLKVNVHKCEGDSLVWDKEAVTTLPSRYGNPKAQRTVSAGTDIICLMEENNGQFTLASCSNPASEPWQKHALAFPFSPQLRTLNAVGSDLYILDSTGGLHRSVDAGTTWTDCNTKWINIIGDFNDTLLGITELNATAAFDIYPRPQGFSPYTLPDDFPTTGLSNFNKFSTKWSDSEIGFFTGGSRGNLHNNACWAYDGENWAKISETPLPALNQPVIIPYFSYRKTNASWIQTEFSVLLCLGGRLPDGSDNNTIYISYDNGVSWRAAGAQMQAPDFAHPGYAADAAVRSIPMDANLNDSWMKAAPLRHAPQLRISYEIDGDRIQWDCPYIYLFGGIRNNATNDRILRAVLARLTFTPIF